MNSTNHVFRLIEWLWDNPWSIIAILASITLVAILTSHQAEYFHHRGLKRCLKCLDESRIRHKVAYSDRSSAEAAANRYMKKFGYQHPYFQPTCGYWHLTSQKPRSARPQRNRR